MLPLTTFISIDYLENNDYYCPSVEKLVNKLVRQTGRRTRAETSEKSPSFRRTGRVMNRQPYVNSIQIIKKKIRCSGGSVALN